MYEPVGPEAIRSASGMIRTYNPVQPVQVFGALSCIDYGDAPTAPGDIEDTLRRIEEFVEPLAAAGVVGVGMGGDHSVTLAELRALAAVNGPLGLVQLDSHTDLWDSYNGLPYAHGTMFRRAIEEAVSPERSGARAAGRVRGGPTFLSLDVDFVDCAFCPGTGTPEVAGPSSFQAMPYLRALADIPFVGYDVVEVAPPYDGPGQATALLAANAMFEILSMIARGGRDGNRASTSPAAEETT